MKKSPFAAAAAILAALFVLATAAPALAHDALKSSDPAKDATVKTLDEVTLEFTGNVRMPFVIVRGAGEVQFQAGKPDLDGPVVTQKLKGELSDGKYVIAYRVVSSDGHPIEGEIPFTVKGATPSQSPTAAPEATESAAPAAPPRRHRPGAGRSTPVSAEPVAAEDEATTPRSRSGCWSSSARSSASASGSCSARGRRSRDQGRPARAGGGRAAVAGLVIAMIAGGAAFPRIILGVPSSGAVTRWGLPISKLFLDVAGLTTVGLLLAATRPAAQRQGHARQDRARLCPGRLLGGAGLGRGGLPHHGVQRLRRVGQAGAGDPQPQLPGRLRHPGEPRHRAHPRGAVRRVDRAVLAGRHHRRRLGRAAAVRPGRAAAAGAHRALVVLAQPRPGHHRLGAAPARAGVVGRRAGGARAARAAEDSRSSTSRPTASPGWPCGVTSGSACPGWRAWWPGWPTCPTCGRPATAC